MKPHLEWGKIKNTVLGKRFCVSIAVVRGSEMRRIGRILRNAKKTKSFAEKHTNADVLSFAFGKGEGEIILNADAIRKEAKKIKQPFTKQLLSLYIHGLLHIKGYDHIRAKDARRMEKEEQRIRKCFVK